MVEASVWTAQPGGQRLFLNCPIFEVLFHGTRGCAKTDALLMAFAQFCGQGYGDAWRGILFRNTYKQLEEVIAKVYRWLYPVFDGFHYNRGEHTCYWKTGETLVLRHMDRDADYWNYHGHEYPFVGWDELTNWATPVVYHKMKSCCRSSVEGLPRMYRATTNPYGRGHNWVKAYFIDPAPEGVIVEDEIEIGDGHKMTLKRTHVKGHYRENMALMKADPEYPAKIAQGKDPMVQRAWLEGDWDIVAGGMFDDIWSPHDHVIPEPALPQKVYIFRAFDWGSSKPYSVGWYIESDGATQIGGRAYPRGSLIRFAELYGSTGQPNEGTRETAHQIADRILAREQQFGRKVHPGPGDGIWDGSRGKSIADQMAEKGVHFQNPDMKQKDRVAGWEKVRQALQAARDWPPEKPGLWVAETCRHFIRTVPVLPRDEAKPDDVDSEAEDHVADEVRYACMRRDVRAKVERFRL